MHVDHIRLRRMSLLGDEQSRLGAGIAAMRSHRGRLRGVDGLRKARLLL